MALNGKNDSEKLLDLSSRTYKEQAIWWLNAYWDKHEADAEKLWSFVAKFSQLDLDKKAEGNGLDELNAHRFLESYGETKTVKELRDSLRETGALGPNERPKAVPLIHYLLFRYRPTTDWHYLVNASQGDNKAEIEEAMRMLEEVLRLFQESERKAQEAAAALKEAEAQEANAKAREAEAQRAQEELTAALAELKSQEDAFNSKTDSLRTKSEDESVSVVGRNKAKNELAQHLSSDPLPLRKAKITQEAAVKKAEKATAAAADARVKAQAARKSSADAKAAAEDALQQARQQVQKAEDYLNEVKRKPGQAQGALWWIQRGLDDAKSFLPERKGGAKRVDTTR
jgi:DNA repair exonuclease SbcCD ATPase subunit